MRASILSSKSILKGTIWGILARLIVAGVRFLSIPLLVGLYGKSDYGLIILAFSLNTFVRLMDLGINVSSVKFFSQWISNGDWNKVSEVSNSSIIFYGSIGLLNATILVIMAQYHFLFFSISENQLEIFKFMLYVLAFSSIISWPSGILNQILSACGDLAWIEKNKVISSLLELMSVILVVKMGLPLFVYFTLYILSTLAVIPLNIFRLKKYGTSVFRLFRPIWNSRAFKEIVTYGMSIFVMSIFQSWANFLRPLILNKFSTEGSSSLTDFRIIDTICTLVILLGGVFTTSMLPSLSALYSNNNLNRIQSTVLFSTRITCFFIFCIISLLIVNAKNIIILYMGTDYLYLTTWLQVALFSLVGFHLGPVSSAMLASGRTKQTMYMAGFSCIVSLVIGAILVPKFGVGASVIGYAIYQFLQMLFYYVYLIPRILNTNSIKFLFNTFLPVLFIAFISMLFTKYFVSVFDDDITPILSVILTSLLLILVYIIMSFVLFFRKEELAKIRNIIIKKESL